MIVKVFERFSSVTNCNAAHHQFSAMMGDNVIWCACVFPGLCGCERVYIQVIHILIVIV